MLGDQRSGRFGDDGPRLQVRGKDYTITKIYPETKPNHYAMQRTVHIEKSETIPDDASVVHYDELDGNCKEQFPELIKNSPTEESIHPKSTLSNGDYVKFTNYYRVTCR